MDDSPSRSGESSQRGNRLTPPAAMAVDSRAQAHRPASTVRARVMLDQVQIGCVGGRGEGAHSSGTITDLGTIAPGGRWGRRPWPLLPPTHRLLTSKSNWVVGAGPTRAQTLKRAGETAGHARDPPVSSRHALELLATPAAQPTETDHCTFSQPKRTCNAKTRLCRCCAFSACCKLSPPSKVHLSRSRVLRSIDSILTCNQAVGHVPRSNHTKH